MLGRRLRQWTNIAETSDERLVWVVVFDLQSASRQYTLVSTIHWANVGLMLGQRLRRWTNIKPTSGECFLSRLVLSWPCHTVSVTAVTLCHTQPT